MASSASMTLYEPICKDAVHWLVRHVDEYVEDGYKEQVQGVLKKTLDAFEGKSKVLVEYQRKIQIGDSLYGRLYSNGAGLQMLWKVFRGALIRHSMELYGLKMYDIDMENATRVFSYNYVGSTTSSARTTTLPCTSHGAKCT